MKNYILILIMTAVLLLVSCTGNKPEEVRSTDQTTDEVDETIPIIDGYLSVELNKYSQKYNSFEISNESSTFLNSLVAETITDYKSNDGYKFLVFKNHFGNILCANGYEDILGEDSGYQDIIYSVDNWDEPYHYPLETIEVAEFQNVLGYNGITFSFTAGADSRPIIYWAFKDKRIFLLAECNKSNYEVDVTGDGVNDLITDRSSVAEVIYMIDGELYKTVIGEALSGELNIESIWCLYDVENGKFIFGEFLGQTEGEAFIKNNILYYKITTK